MSATAKKLVIVLGATGAQGLPTAKYLLQNSSGLFRVRAVTRDRNKPASQELAALGAEVVGADYDNEASLADALTGAHAVFAITNFWDKASYDLEVAQGKLVNKLASQLPNLKSYIFSSLPDARKSGNGKFQNILPYNAKAAIRDDLYTYPALASITTEIFVAFYYQNWLKYPAVFGPLKDENGTFVLSMPYPRSTRFPSTSADDTGVVVDSILRAGTKYYGKIVALATELSQQDDMLALWANHLGIKAVFKQVSAQEHQKRMSARMPDHLAVAVTELCENLCYGEKTFGDSKNVISARDMPAKHKQIIPSSYKLKSWEDYVKEEDWSEIV
ncbi:NmrA-like family domain-containing protein [Lachnellula occidentalis]|uniref:NmrA-like family domain-containing protein n=1 Tax=Lachnellula occidentalis TaxID=215460 RepID=A0A8H8RKD4_9HELO|nr:NmrA-like family domain-containing protein [Lachnellula occidentalis]